jgi:hypothetical protein
MENKDLFDSALSKLMDDMDDMEGSSAMSHSMDECPDPLICPQHDSETGENLTSEHSGTADNVTRNGADPVVSIEIKKMGLPTLEGDNGQDESGSGMEADSGLHPEELEALRKLLR